MIVSPKPLLIAVMEKQETTYDNTSGHDALYAFTSVRGSQQYLRRGTLAFFCPQYFSSGLLRVDSGQVYNKNK